MVWEPLYKSLALTILFEKDTREIYEEYQDDIYQRILDVHHTIAALECLADSTLEEVSSKAETRFWSLLGRNFWSAAVVTLYGLVEYQAAKLSIRRFAELVLELDWCDEQARLSYEAAVQGADVAVKAAAVQTKLTGFRNQVYAHRFISKKKGAISEPKARLDLKELREVYGDVERLFSITCVGGWFETTLF